LAQAVTCLTCVLEVPGLNLSWVTAMLITFSHGFLHCLWQMSGWYHEKGHGHCLCSPPSLPDVVISYISFISKLPLHLIEHC